MKRTNNNISITDTTNGRIDISNLPFDSIASRILGEGYTLSLAFVSPEESQKFNKEYRQKDTPTDVLSFPLEEDSGEIVICPEVANERKDDFDRDLKFFLLYLFIHGCFHLAGYDHGSEMEEKEKELREAFDI